MSDDMLPLEIWGPGDELLAKLREVCLAFPEAVEAGGVGAPSFKVRDRIFAMQHRQDGRPSLWCKALPGAQDVLIGAEPARFFRPPYVGQHGWVGIWLDRDDVDWRHIGSLVDEAFRMTAPKRLVKADARLARRRLASCGSPGDRRIILSVRRGVRRGGLTPPLRKV